MIVRPFKTRFCLALSLFVLSATAQAQTILWDTLVANSGNAFASQSNGAIPSEASDDFIVSSSLFPGGVDLNSITFQGLLSNSSATINSVHIELYQEFPFDSNTARTPVTTRANGPADIEFAALTFAPGQFTETRLGAFTVSQTITPGTATQFGAVGPGLTGDLRQVTVALNSPIRLAPTDPTFTTHINHYWLSITADTSGGDYYWVAGSRPPVVPSPAAVDRQTWLRTNPFNPDWKRVSDIINNANGTTTPAFNSSFRVSGAAATPEPGAMASAGACLLSLFAFGYRKRKK